VLREALPEFVRTHGFARAAAVGQLQFQQLAEQRRPRRLWQAGQVILGGQSLACPPGRREALIGRLHLPG
jgi:hypothetical protein